MTKGTATGLRKLLEDQVAQMYYTEKQLIMVLDGFAIAATTDELKDAFAELLEAGKTHVERLEQVFVILGIKAFSRQCPAMDDIIEEGRRTISELNGDPALEAGLIAIVQKAAHYQLASYASMCQWSREMGHTKAEDQLHQTLEEIRAADDQLSSIAYKVVRIEGETA